MGICRAWLARCTCAKSMAAESVIAIPTESLQLHGSKWLFHRSDALDLRELYSNDQLGKLQPVGDSRTGWLN